MAFCSQKPAAVSAAVGCLSLFASDIGFLLPVGRTEVRPTSLRMAVFTSVASPSGLDEGCNSDEMMNGHLNTLTYITIYFHQRFIKPLAKRKAMSGVVLPFSFHQPFPFVERLMRM